MKWKYLSRFLLLTFLFLLSGSALAKKNVPLAPPEVTGQAIYIPFPVAITLDGEQSDWEGVPRTIVSRGSMTSSKVGENDSFIVAVAADSINLYVLMTMQDQNIVTGQHGTDFWNEDSLEFFVNFSRDLSAQAYSNDIFQVNINPGDMGNTDPAALTITGVNAALSHTQGVVFKTADGWGFEAAVPLPFAPEHGKEIGFQAQANGATQLDRDVKLIWSLADTGDQSWQNPSLFGRSIFFEIGREDIPPFETSVQSGAAPDALETTPEVLEATPEIEEGAVMERAITAVNQVGYFVSGKKIAVYGREIEAAELPTWELRKRDTLVAAGKAESSSFDSVSDNYVYRIDFTSFSTPGLYVLSVDGLDSQPFQIANDIYVGLARDSLRYFYLNRSGIKLESQFAGEWARPAGHLTDNDVTCLIGQDTSGKSWDGCDYRLDGSGGWYDAGDYGKYVVNGGIATWTLMNAYERNPNYFLDSTLNIPESGNNWPDILDEARWEMDFLLRMQVPEGQPLAGMAHHKLHDRRWAGLPILPPTEFDNDDPNNGRFLMPPSTAATLNLAATAAQCARVWKELDSDFADHCLKAAETAWTAANENPSMLYGSIPGEGGGDYGDDNVQDEFYWAAAELYITTGKDEYRDFILESAYFKSVSNSLPIWWGGTAALGSISLALLPNGLPEAEISRLRDEIVQAADRYFEISQSEGYRAPITVNEYVWGSNSGVLNNALILALAHDFTDDPKYLEGVIASMDYILGENAINQSFVSGYGTIAMQHPHHRFWANQPSRGFPLPPPGALAGGPNGSPADPAAIDAVSDLPVAQRYIDDIDSYSTNEVAINWNAPLAWVAAYLDEQFNKSS